MRELSRANRARSITRCAMRNARSHDVTAPRATRFASTGLARASHLHASRPRSSLAPRATEACARCARRRSRLATRFLRRGELVDPARRVRTSDSVRDGHGDPDSTSTRARRPTTRTSCWARWIGPARAGGGCCSRSLVYVAASAVFAAFAGPDRLAPAHALQSLRAPRGRVAPRPARPRERPSRRTR